MGNVPAIAAASSVMASAKRLIEARQFWLSRISTAEISVPAWPMPIHHTVLVIMKPQAAGILRPAVPMPLMISHVTEHRNSIANKKQIANPSQNHFGRRPASGTLAIRPAMAGSLGAPLIAWSDTVAHLREIRRARPRAERGKHRVARRLRLLRHHPRGFVLDVAETDGAR